MLFRSPGFFTTTVPFSHCHCVPFSVVCTLPVPEHEHSKTAAHAPASKDFIFFILYKSIFYDTLFYKRTILDIDLIRFDGSRSILFRTRQIAETTDGIFSLQIYHQRMRITGSTSRAPVSGLLQVIHLVSGKVTPACARSEERRVG